MDKYIYILLKKYLIWSNRNSHKENKRKNENLRKKMYISYIVYRYDTCTLLVFLFFYFRHFISLFCNITIS